VLGGGSSAVFDIVKAEPWAVSKLARSRWLFAILYPSDSDNRMMARIIAINNNGYLPFMKVAVNT